MPEWVAQDFLLSELAKVLTQEENLSKLSAFSICLDNFALRRIFARKRQNFQTNFGYSVVKQQWKRKRSGNFLSLDRETCVTAPKTILSFFLENSLNFYALGAETKPLPLY